MRGARGCVAAIALVLLLIVGGGAAAWWWLQSAPSWYDPPDAADPAVVAFAETVEKRVVEEMQRIRPEGDDAWTLRVRDGQLNAWLLERLPAWLEREASFAWPPALGAPQAHFGPDGIDVGIAIREGPLAERVVVARVEPALVDDRMALRLVSVGLGRARIGSAPIERFTDLLGSVAPDALDPEARERIVALLDGRTTFEPVVPLADGRHVRVIDFRLHDGAVDITSRTR